MGTTIAEIISAWGIDRPGSSLGWLLGLALTCLATVPVLGQNAAPAVPTPTRPLVVAHRGASADAPENTLAAFRLAWEQQADAIEGDFFLSLDQEIVTLHDRSTLRTGGVDWDVSQKTLAELKGLDVGSWKASAFAGERIPTLEEVAAVVPDGKKLFLEIKDSPRLVPVLKQKVESDPGLKKLADSGLVIIAFDPEVIAACKRELPHVPAFWLTSFKKHPVAGTIQPTIDQILTTLDRIQADGLDCKADPHIDRDFVQKLREAGYEFHVWTVDDPQVAQRFIDLGVDSITTNVPQIIRQQCQIPLE